ncbi:hypothetical protein A0H81_02217 [Grifola frondosa]|uniref:Uncharacterized protein n=1 Tax=Grifola frondosa TaxID=5627 RepID=A0A1C7MLA1_GRIFR|nr:hypothetical protein A0H81_02217 [Grifola frondosa]
MSGNDDREVEKSHSSNHALGWARHFRNRECTRTWSQSAPGGGRQVTSPRLPVHPSVLEASVSVIPTKRYWGQGGGKIKHDVGGNPGQDSQSSPTSSPTKKIRRNITPTNASLAELADSDDSMSESASQLRFRPIVGVALNSHTLKPVVSPMTAAPPTPVPVGDLEMGHEQHTPAATPHPSNGHNNPANPSVVPILHGERTQVPVDHDIEMSHGDHNPIPATRADILELRQDLKDIGFPLDTPQSQWKRPPTAMDVDGDDGDNADVEDVPPPRPRVEQARKAKAITKHRSDNALSLSRDVQQHARFLMNRESSDSPFDIAFMASEEDVSAFNPFNGYCCTAADFRPDLRSPPGTPWNKSVTKVFVKSFIEEGIYSCTDAHMIEVAFQTHLKYLRTLHQRAGISKLENTARKRAAKRAERKRNLFYRRFEVAANHTDLQRHLGILQDLGVDGMSSDESEHENGVIQYRVLIKSWRNPVLTPWLRTFDAAYRKDRLSGPSQSTRGAHPHLRLASQKVDLRAPVIRLPFNAYNYEWLKGLSAFELESLAPQHREYEFLHTPAMMELAQAFDGDHHKSRPYV